MLRREEMPTGGGGDAGEPAPYTLRAKDDCHVRTRHLAHSNEAHNLLRPVEAAWKMPRRSSPGPLPTNTSVVAHFSEMPVG